jgi:hypothetical protein
LGSMRAPAWGDPDRPKTHRLRIDHVPIRHRWENGPESCWRVTCTCSASFSSVDHDYAEAEGRAHLVVSGAASPLWHVYHLAKAFLAGNRELHELVREPDYTLGDFLRDAVAAIPQPRPEPRPENAEKNEKRRVEQERKLCHYCYELFTPKRKDQEFCSPSHRQLAYIRRKKNAAARVLTP